MSNAPASIYKTQKTCPLCSEKAEFELPQDFHCPRCGRRKSLFLQAFDSHSSGVIHDKVVYLEDQVRVWKESYEELERLAREQVAKLERSANTAWEQVRLADNNLILATNALRSIQSHAIGSAYILMVCNDALRKIEGDRHHPAPAVPEGWQPIETAPKDGTKVLLARIGRNEAGKDLGIWWACKGFWSARWNNWNDGCEPCGLAGPTHWMPLPAAPEAPK